MLEAEELEAVAEEMVARYRALGFDGIASRPRPVTLLFAWMQGGDADGPRAAVSEAARTDMGLVEVLERLTGRIGVSDRRGARIVEVLGRENLEHFMDFDEARSRVAAIASDQAGSGLGDRATRLIERLDAGDRH